MSSTGRPIYVIKDWELLYETYESKRLARGCSWLAMPNKHDGRGFRRLIREKEGAALYGAWAILLQVASKCPVRGVLADLDGPLDAEDLEDKTGIPAKYFERTLELTTSERIGWTRAVTDSHETTALLAGVTAVRTHAARKAPQTPASSGKTPAGLQSTPAGFGQNGESTETPADSRKFPQNNAPHGRALADSTVQDSTRQDTVAGATDGLLETANFCLRLFGKKRSRLSQDAEQQLARWAPDLPLSPEEHALIERFMALAHDDRDFDLRSRPGSADLLAKNLFAVLERAGKYFDRNSIPDKKTAGGVDADRFRTWFTAKFPDKPLAPSLEDVPDYILADFRKEVAA